MLAGPAPPPLLKPAALVPRPPPSAACTCVRAHGAQMQQRIMCAVPVSGDVSEASKLPTVACRPASNMPSQAPSCRITPCAGTYHAAWLTCFNLPKGLGTAAPRCMTGSGKGRQVAWYAAGAAVIPCDAVRKLRSRQVASLREAEDPARGRYLSHLLSGGRPHGEAIFNEAEVHRNGKKTRKMSSMDSRGGVGKGVKCVSTPHTA